MTYRKQFGIAFILIPIIMIVLMSGCSFGKKSDSDVVTGMWIVTELTTSDSFNYQIEQAVATFEAEHEGITVRVDILPTDEAEREVYQQQIRTQIMAGNGPDVYILPTDNVLTVDSKTKFSQKVLTSQIEIDPLFQDVKQAMHSGVFADISSFYDTDADLNTGALHQDVMDAGVIDGRRYVLPLRYTMPILLTEPSNYDDTGITQECIDSGIDALAAYAVETNDAMMAVGLRIPDDTTLLSQLFDYEKGEMVITLQEIADYMRLYQQVYALAQPTAEQYIAGLLEELRVVLDELYNHYFEDPLAAAMVEITLDSFNSVDDYGEFGYHWSLNGFPLYTDTLTGALEQTAISKVLGKDLMVQPMRRSDGTIVADITYYGAVGSSCANTELAYSFLRTFLTEDYQWDLVRPRAKRENIDFFNLPQEKQVDGLIENSWPVRTGAAAHLWDSLQYQNFYEGYVYEDYNKALKSNDLDITDADMPILNVSIDEVRFPLCQPYEESLSYALTLLNNEDGTPTGVDIDELADEVYQYLWWHLAEG